MGPEGRVQGRQKMGGLECEGPGDWEHVAFGCTETDARLHGFQASNQAVKCVSGETVLPAPGGGEGCFLYHQHLPAGLRSVSSQLP